MLAKLALNTFLAATGDEAQHVRAVVHHARSDLVCRVGELLQGRWEEEHRGSKQGKGGFCLADHGGRCVDVRLHAVFVPRIADGFDGVEIVATPW